jgi:hypothetical protein
MDADVISNSLDTTLSHILSDSQYINADVLI